jgi:lysophospholipase L1-like esterase
VVTTTAPTPTPTPTIGPDGCRIRQPLPAGSVLSIIGDSFTTGDPKLGGDGPKGWPAILGRRTGWKVYKDAQGASGYLSHGFTGKAFDGLIYLDQVKKLPAQHPDLVIVFGSDNDLRHTEPPWFVEYVRKTLEAVHRAAPNAYLVVATTFWYDDNPIPEILYIGRVLKSEASRIPCTAFIDAIAEKWFGMAHRDLYNVDHPSDAGHVHLADMWERDLRRLHLIE